MIEEGYDINLCGTEWFIQEVPKDHKELDGDDGVCNFNRQIIYINDELHSHRKSLALVHEMLHVVCDSIGLEEDEDTIRKLEHGVYELLNVYPDEYKKSTETEKLIACLKNGCN